MRIVYGNVSYRKSDTRGRNAHIRQFVEKVTASGHEIWVWPGNEHPDARLLPKNRIKRWKTLRRMDALYIRLQGKPPGTARYALNPYRQLIGSPIIVWEFNTVPEFLYVMGESNTEVQQSIDKFQYLGRGCDLAICVSSALSEYVRDKIGIRRVLTVPNGSDPDLFHPKVAPVKEVKKSSETFNVVWMGSADLSWHNFELMCDAADLLWNKYNYSRITLHFVGGGLKLADEMPSNFRCHGPREHKTIPRWLAAMDVGLCLYHPGPANYGSPLKLYDYMSSGLAVVGTPQPQVREVFTQLGQLDLLVPPDEPDALANVLMDLESNRERVRHLGEAGRKLVISHYNWGRAVKDILDEIETLLEDRAKK
jgi:glycosyltransferase involved in cell wall biosynthesis